jgi:hypothetical protein
MHGAYSNVLLLVQVLRRLDPTQVAVHVVCSNIQAFLRYVLVRGQTEKKMKKNPEADDYQRAL